MDHSRHQENCPLCGNAPNSSRRKCQNLERTTEAFKPYFEKGGEGEGREIVKCGYHLPYLH